ncbi:MAG TPA: RHS repeat-associated core domain-containing protein [Acidimicrobiales bacterium]|nr:RHS repeat-associated core domain-containing protein [Acidimicrobiales bacterium]
MQTLVALVALVALVGSTVAIGPATSSGADRQRHQSVAPLTSPRLFHAAPDRPEGYSTASRDRASSPEVRPLPQEDTATSDVWLNADGSTHVRFYSSPHNYQPGGQGTFVPIVTTLEADPTHPGRWRSTANSWTASFGSSDSPTSSMQLVGGRGPFGFSPVGASPVTPSVTGSVATYTDLWPDVNARYDVTATGVKEDIELISASAQASFSFDLTSATTAKPSDTTGGLQLVAGDQVLAEVPPLVVTTAQGTTVPAAISGATLQALSDGTGRAGSGIVVAVSPTWLAELPSSTFPVTIDPTAVVFFPVTGSTTLSVNLSTIDQGTVLQVGYPTPFTTSRGPWRGSLKFNFSSYMGDTPPWVAEAGILNLRPLSGSATEVTPLSVYLDQDLTRHVDWTTVTAGQLIYQGTTTNTIARIPVDSAVERIFSTGPFYEHQWAFGLVGAEGDPGTHTPAPNLKIYRTHVTNGVSLTVTLVRAPPPTSVTSPTTGATIATATPTLTAPSVSTGTKPINYDFRIATQPDGAGQVISSGWINLGHGGGTPSWTVPVGSLVDGTTYYASVITALTGAFNAASQPASITQFKVTLHLGAGGPSPTDSVGAAPGATSTPSAGAPSPGTPPASVTVNLVTGDLSFTSATHSVSTLAGPVGLSLGYNSLESDSHGLFAQYFAGHDFSLTTRIGQRTDAQVDAIWATGKPIGGITSGGYAVEWTGSITVPPGTGTHWQFGILADHSMQVKVGGSVVVTDWTNQDLSAFESAEPTFGATQTLSGGNRSITVKAYGTHTSGTFQLWARQVIATEAAKTWPEYLVPSDWLTPNHLTLPPGWTLSAANLQGGWARLEDLGSTVIVQSASGGTVAFTRTSTGRYEAPAGYTGLYLYVNATKQLQLSTSTDVLYTFEPNGQVSSVTTVADDRHPSALQYTYTPTSLALAAITDPVSTRTVHVYYGGTATHCPSTTPTTDAPTGMLCKIHFWDGTTTLFTYDTSGELVRITNPGDEVADFGYTGHGRVDAIRDPLANDAISAGVEPDCPATGTTSDCETQITYTTTTGSTAKVSTVTQPAPTAAATGSRPKRTYHYTAATRTASVTLAGFAGTDESVKYDAQGKITTETTAAGLTTEAFWNAYTEPIATIGPNGQETATVYDLSGQVTDTYGPAPTACFTSTPTKHRPVATPVGTPGCGVAVPHAHNGYDEGITGFAATYWSNGTYAGAAAAHGTVASADQTWTSPPVAGSSWSTRMIGTITIGSGGAFQVGAKTTQFLRIYISGHRVTTASHGTGGPGIWTPTYSLGTFVPPAAGVYPIEVDFVGSATTANAFDLVYDTGVTLTPIPDTWLDPNYDLKTSSTTPDGNTTDYAYTDAATGIGPQDGLLTATIENPTGLHLTTTTDYENPATAGTYLRRTATALPDGGTTTYLYYGGTAGPIAAACGVSATTPQGGQLKQQTDPAPSTATSSKARVQQFVYDAAGIQAGVRVGDVNDITTASWQCTDYDTRGRITSQSWPAANTSPAKTVTTTYDVGGNPLTTAVETGTTTTTKVTATVDLEGRAASYTSMGKTTTTTYDQAGQVTTSSGPGGLVHNTFNSAGQVDAMTLNGHWIGSARYCTIYIPICAGQLTEATYPGLIIANYGYNDYGKLDQIGYGRTTSGRLFAGDRATYSLGGRELTDDPVPDTFDSTFTNPRSTGGTDFTYDGAGRLIGAYIPGQRIDYTYATSPTANSCTTPTAGMNTNLTAVITYPDAGGTATTGYCYNGADQLTKTVTSGTASTAHTATSTTFAFDDEGYQTENKGSTYTWTASGQLASASSGATTITYSYDAVDRLIQRTKGSTVTRYAYCGYTTSPCAILNSANTVVNEETQSIGGVLVTVHPGSSSMLFSYPNLKGDYIVTNDSSGSQYGWGTYTPYGQMTTSTYVPKNPHTSALNEDAFGKAGKLTEETVATPVVFMGARPYFPEEGRFLSVDPIEGGCANAYVYVSGDPVNSSDLTGEAGCQPPPIICLDCVTDVSTTTISTAQICGMSATVHRGKSRTIYVIDTSDVTATANQCWKNLTGMTNPSNGDTTTHGTAGPGFYQFRYSKKSGGPTIDLNTTKHPTTVIHFQYVKPEESSPCGVQYD